MDPGPFFYIAITIYYLIILFTFLQTITFYHSIRLILCSQQTGDIDNLTVSWDKVLGCVVCRFHVAAGEKLHADKFPSAIVWSVAKLAGINLRKFGSFSYWFDNLGFTTEGRLSAVLIITFSWGFQLGDYIYKTPTSIPHHQPSPPKIPTRSPPPKTLTWSPSINITKEPPSKNTSKESPPQPKTPPRSPPHH
jgi:hypothetical protein